MYAATGVGIVTLSLCGAPSRLTGCALQAVAVEAGMLALRRGGTELKHEDYVEGVTVVQAKKKASLNYYA